MLSMEMITGDAPLMEPVRALYETAFPENERRPLEELIGDDAVDCAVFLNGDTFCGFSLLLTWRDITHILYFAIEERLRNRGCGSAALQLMADRYQGNRLIADLEAHDPKAVNNAQRSSRRAFYLRAGFQPTKVRYTWRGERYEILSLGGNVTNFEFGRFWHAYDARQKRRATDGGNV